MIDTALYEDIRSMIKRRAAYARYRINKTFYETPLNDVAINSDGTIRIKLSIIPNTLAIVNRVEIWNSAKELWMHTDCSIEIETGQHAILFWFDLAITEKEVKNIV